MDKFEFKDKLINVYETIIRLQGNLYEKGLADEELVKIRSEIYGALEQVNDRVKREIYNIY